MLFSFSSLSCCHDWYRYHDWGYETKLFVKMNAATANMHLKGHPLIQAKWEKAEPSLHYPFQGRNLSSKPKTSQDEPSRTCKDP